MSTLSNTILVLGGDGYLGWPLSVSLALKNPSTKIICVDNMLRRKLVRSCGSDSLLPILSPQERVSAFRRIYGQTNLQFLGLDVTSPEITQLIARERPHTIYHLAQQCSAPYSMSSPEAAIFTVNNNEGGNMRLLWAVRDHVPEAHLIKLGSFGEYMNCGLDIMEGYYYPEHNGKKACVKAPFPRQSDDIYHVSKINDSNYISVACRKWGLRVTDIMQATVFGTWTPETHSHPELWTRMDYDEKFGTVMNRFLTQMMIGEALTVYGTGKQRTGLMALSDSVHSLAELVSSVPEPGEHRVINHVTEKSFCINEIAELVKMVGRDEGFQVLVTNAFDPREERPSEKATYDIETKYVSNHVAKTPLATVLRQTLSMIANHRNRIKVEVVVPKTIWRKEATATEASQQTAKPAQCDTSNDFNLLSPSFKSPRKFASLDLIPQLRSADKASIASDEDYWNCFRDQFFPSRRINLNAGTLGTTSMEVRKASYLFYAEDLPAYPLGQYSKGRETLSKVVKLANEIWPSATHEVTVNGSASQCANLLALALSRVAWKEGSRQGEGHPHFTLLTTDHEHVGGIGAFSRLPEFKVSQLSNHELSNVDAFEARVAASRPDIFFVSHISCVTGEIFPVEQWSSIIRRIVPHAIIILDVAQSLGILRLPLQAADCIFGSVHKWLFGPRGCGLLWTNEKLRNFVKAINWSGEEIHPREGGHGFSIPGGQDFGSYAKLEAALRLYAAVGPELIYKRGSSLRKHFEERICTIFAQAGLSVQIQQPFNGAPSQSPCITSLVCTNFDPYEFYSYLNQHGVHVKCMKGKSVGDVVRFSFPYYESVYRIDEALRIIENGVSHVTTQPIQLIAKDANKGELLREAKKNSFNVVAML
eukprot:ANDGO_01679.mRNA.1 UDP-sulfoquinovose synthase